MLYLPKERFLVVLLSCFLDINTFRSMEHELLSIALVAGHCIHINSVLIYARVMVVSLPLPKFRLYQLLEKETPFQEHLMVEQERACKGHRFKSPVCLKSKILNSICVCSFLSQRTVIQFNHSQAGWPTFGTSFVRGDSVQF
jgi:hypothetical protein